MHLEEDGESFQGAFLISVVQFKMRCVIGGLQGGYFFEMGVDIFKRIE